MKIIISEKNKTKIENAIREAEGRSTARTITFENMVSAIDTIETTLGIAKKDMLGIIADVDYNAQSFPGAYKYTPQSTHFIAERVASGWAITDIRRWTTRGCTQTYKLTLTDRAKEAIIENMQAF